MIRFHLRARIYAALVCLTVLTALVAWWQWDEQWAHEWLPNFIAEWSGLFVAVAIVDQLLARAREAEQHRRRAPERQLAGDRLAHALERMTRAAVGEWARDRRDLEPAAPLASFWTAWLAEFEERADVRSDTWLRLFADSLNASSAALNRFRSFYDSALEPHERAHVGALSHRLADDAGAIRHWADDVDPDYEPRGVREHLPRQTPEQVAHLVRDRCVGLTQFITDVARDYRAMTGVELTSEAAWESVRLARAGAEYIAAKIIEERAAQARLGDEGPGAESNA